MNEIPQYPKREEIPPDRAPMNPTVAASIAKPTAFSKPGSMSGQNTTRVRTVKPGPKRGRPRKRERDKRDIVWY